MSTLAKLAGFAVLGIAVLIVGGIVLGLLATVLKMLVPIAILAAIGWVVWQVMSGSAPPPAQEEKPRVAAPPAQEKKGLSEDEYLKSYEEMTKCQPN